MEILANMQNDPIRKQNLLNLAKRTESVSDLSKELYDRFNQNKNNMSFWLPDLAKAISKQDFFIMPRTKIIRMDLALSQFFRLEYQLTSKELHDLVSQLLFNQFNLDNDKEYFIKTGEFSSKFEFANAHLVEPEEISEYFQVIQNLAMSLGAGRSNDLVVREWIEDKENHPTIYDGMPLRTEFRSFIDVDKDELIQTVPYWHPIVMKRTFSSKLEIPSIKQDYQTYLEYEDTLTSDYNSSVSDVNRHIKDIMHSLHEQGFKGQWSLDTMKANGKFYLIDMALMNESALTELIGR